MNRLILLSVALAAAGLPTGCGGSSSSEALYCYKTLANVDCYSQPVAQDRRRLVGYVGEPPPPPFPPQQLAVLPAPAPRRDIAEIWDGDQISR